MGKRRRYSDEFRASAVVMLEAQGYPGTSGALTAVARHLGVPQRTLSRWFNREQNPPPDELVKEKKGELTERLADLIDVFVERMVAEAEDAPLNHLATAFGIAFDKKQLLDGGPTERVEATVHDSRERLAHLVNRHAARLGEGVDTGRTH